MTFQQGLFKIFISISLHFGNFKFPSLHHYARTDFTTNSEISLRVATLITPQGTRLALKGGTLERGTLERWNVEHWNVERWNVECYFLPFLLFINILS